MRPRKREGTEMERIEFAMPDAVELKIAGEPLVVLPHKMDAGWLAEMLAYGIRRKVNDTYSGAGENKLDLCRAMVKDLNEGVAFEGRQRRATVTMDTAEKLAFDAARTDLTAIFKARTKLAKLADMARAEPELVGKYLAVGEDGRASWNNQEVMAWVERLREAGKRDYLAEAREALERAGNAEEDLEL